MVRLGVHLGDKGPLTGGNRAMFLEMSKNDDRFFSEIWRRMPPQRQKIVECHVPRNELVGYDGPPANIVKHCITPFYRP